MSSTHLSAVWSSKEPRGKARLVLLAVADCANHIGVAEASARTLAAMTGEDKSAVCDMLDDLRKAGFIRLVSVSRGAIPARYQVTVAPGASPPPEEVVPPDTMPDTEPDAIPPVAVEQAPDVLSVPIDARPQMLPANAGSIAGIVQADVDAVLVAAEIEAPPESPFYWNRREHRDDLAALLKKTGLSLDDLCSQLRNALNLGRTLSHQPKRLTELESLIGKGGRA